MHVRVRFVGKPEAIVVVESKLTKIDQFRHLVCDKFDVEPDLQRLFYGGKVLENGYTFHDYNIKLNDVIQLMVKITPKLEKKDKNTKDELKLKQEEDKKLVYEDAKSSLYEIGDVIDMRDREHGAWFEGRIVKIVKNPNFTNDNLNKHNVEETHKSDKKSNTLNHSEHLPKNGKTIFKNNENGEPSQEHTKNDENKPDSSIDSAKKNCDSFTKTNKNSNTTPKKELNNPETTTNANNQVSSENKSPKPVKKKGITDYFSKSPKGTKLGDKLQISNEITKNNLEMYKNVVTKNENGMEVDEQDTENRLKADKNCQENGVATEDITNDIGLLYKVQLIYEDDKGVDYYCKLNEIRPRARKVIEIDDVKIGHTIMINYNTEEPIDKGYWYDFKVSEVKKLRKNYELLGTIYLGSEAFPQNDTKVRVHDQIYEIEQNVPLKDRSEDYKKIIKTEIKRRSMPLNCTTCKDDYDQPCKDCGCFLCLGKENPNQIILCDECNNGYHMDCLNPPMTALPDDDWYCPDCKRNPNDVIAPGAQKQTKKINQSKTKRDWGRGMACAGKTQTCAMPANHFGPIPGIEVGMCWRFRIQLSESGVHRPPVSGIHGRDVDGAYSLVLSGGYEDDVDYGKEFTYTGSGGRDLSGNKRTADQSSDQTLTRENKALARNCAVKSVCETGGDAGEKWRDGKPVRVVRSYKMIKHFPKYAPKEGIRYDGIYKVVKYYPEKGKSGFRVWKYLLRRDDPNPAPWEKGAKEYSIVYPDGYLEAEAEKRAQKEKSTKNGKKRVLKESNHISNNDDDSKNDSLTDSPPNKKRKTRNSKIKEDKNEDSPKRKGRPPKTQKETPKNQEKIPKSPINPFTIAAKLKSPKTPTKSKKTCDNGEESPENSESSPNKKKVVEEFDKLEEILTKEEIRVIQLDILNKKLWDECLDICRSKGKQQFVNHITQLFLCIICQEVAANPVTTKCHHNFCMACLKLAFKSTGTQNCSYCRQNLSKEELECNESLRNALRTIMPGYDAKRK